MLNHQTVHGEKLNTDIQGGCYATICYATIFDMGTAKCIFYLLLALMPHTTIDVTAMEIMLEAMVDRQKDQKQNASDPLK